MQTRRQRRVLRPQATALECGRVRTPIRRRTGVIRRATIEHRRAAVACRASGMRCNYDLDTSARNYDHTQQEWRAEARLTDARISTGALCTSYAWGREMINIAGLLANDRDWRGNALNINNLLHMSPGP